MLRLANVFGLIYTRFLDLKKTEDQAELILQEKTNLQSTLDHLKATQSQLIHSEKMASLGELTAGIAHEIQNPLNFVNNFSEINKELLAEMNEALSRKDLKAAVKIADEVMENEEKVNRHGKRADSIVKGMLQHAQKSSGQKKPTDLNKLVDEYLRLANLGFRKGSEFTTETETDYDERAGEINIVPQEIGRVLLNLINNAFYAVAERQKTEGAGYIPKIMVATKRINEKIELIVRDNGSGISQKVIDKIFQPFFTTKPTGQGTGLGLSLSYDIIKSHGGEIRVNSEPDNFTEFVVSLPA
jgi:signal transduction histidine kinase